MQLEYSLLVGETASTDHLPSLSVAGTGGSTPWPQLAQDVVTRWPNAVVLVELPLARVTDPVLAKLEPSTRTCGSEVYAVASASDGTDALEKAFRATDPASLYVAAVALPTPYASAAACPTDELKAANLVIARVIAGAFDGEGFLIADVV
jgi:hypothetical protein